MSKLDPGEVDIEVKPDDTEAQISMGTQQIIDISSDSDPKSKTKSNSISYIYKLKYLKAKKQYYSIK